MVVEQVNLRTVGSERQMQKMREEFAKAALVAARRWLLNPAPGESDRGYDVARIPVDFAIRTHPSQMPAQVYGQWEVYIPGPRQRAPWAAGEDASPDAMASGELYPEGGQRRLMTSLQSG